MNTISLCGADLAPLPSGGLFWPRENLLCVSDLHLGRSERLARKGGPLLPPFENMITLGKLAEDIAATDARTVICLGDSFDDLAAAEGLDEESRARLIALQAGRRWLWIEGNHDPGPVDLGGAHLAQARIGPLTFRHIAAPGATGEVSGHFHPKLALPGMERARPCFLHDDARLILPAYGAYTGGLSALAPDLARLFTAPRAVVTGPRLLSVRLPGSGHGREAPPGRSG